MTGSWCSAFWAWLMFETDPSGHCVPCWKLPTMFLYLGVAAPFLLSCWFPGRISLKWHPFCEFHIRAEGFLYLWRQLQTSNPLLQAASASLLPLSQECVLAASWLCVPHPRHRGHWTLWSPLGFRWKGSLSCLPFPQLNSFSKEILTDLPLVSILFITIASVES